MARRTSAGVSLATIARELNISVSTVSRALRGAEGVDVETRTRAVAAAKSQGYDVDKRRDSHDHNRPRCLMALAQADSPASDQGYRTGMHRASVAMNLAILPHHVAAAGCENMLEPKFQPAAMRVGLVEGLILIHRWPLDIAYRLSEKWPAVSILHYYNGAPIDHVGIDDRSGMWTLVRHLHAGGHRRMGFFGLCRETSWSCVRFAAFVLALQASGLSCNPADVVEINLAGASAPRIPQGGEWAGKVLERAKAGVDAWVCSSSAAASALCRHLTDQGFRIPEDVAVAGYHRNSPLPAEGPLVTSTVILDEDLGAAALRQIIYRIENPAEGHRSILLPVTFLQGETTRRV